MSEPWSAAGKRVIVKTPEEYAAEACNNGRGIECPSCGCKHWDVKRTVREDGRIKRERECRNCRHPMTTYELPEPATGSISSQYAAEES